MTTGMLFYSVQVTTVHVNILCELLFNLIWLTNLLPCVHLTILIISILPPLRAFRCS